MIEEEIGGAGAVREINERGGGISGAAVDERRSAEPAEGGIEVAKALGEPPAGDPAGVVGALFLGGPDEDGDDLAGADGGGESGVVLEAKVAAEPDDGAGGVMEGAGAGLRWRSRHQASRQAGNKSINPSIHQSIYQSIYLSI
jgi:hypothetical protein